MVSPSACEQAAMGDRRGREPEERPRQVPVSSMHQLRALVARLRLPQAEPGNDRQACADDDVLRKDAPGEGDQHPRKLIDRPEADKLRIVEPPWNNIPVGHATLPSSSRDQMVAVTTEVTIGTPVPTPIPTPKIGRAHV